MVFFTVTFNVNKLLIFKYYQRSRTFNRTIPLFSQKFFKLGLAVHIIGATFMLTNPEPFETDPKTQVGRTAIFDTIKDDMSLISEHNE